MRCLVTGGAGFIGSNLSRSLVKRGLDVIILDNFSTGKRNNIKDMIHDVELCEGDVRNQDLLLDKLRGVTYVFHQAALPSVKRSVDNPLASNSNNIDGTLNVLWASLKNNVQRVVCASSSSIYGDTVVLPKHEGMLPNPLSPYALTKYTTELYCRLFSNLYQLETLSLRYFNVFGPFQDPSSPYSAVIPQFIARMLLNKPPIIHGDGNQTRDFCYIDNVVEANLLAMQCNKTKGEGVNVGCGERINLLQLVELINDRLGTQLTATHMPPRSGDVKESLASIELAKELLGYCPKVKVKEGLQKLIAWSRQNT